MIRAVAPDGSCDKFADFGNVSCVACILDAETIQLHPQDGVSVKLWVERPREENTSVFYKDRLDTSPPGLQMHEKDVLLCIQTQYHLDTFWCLGCGFIGIDVTHNMTQYEGIMLYTMITHDDWGHGALALAFVWISPLKYLPVVRCTSCLDAHIIYENGSHQVFFLNWVQAASLDIRPSIFMSDCDQAQIVAIEQAYLLSQIFLCTWHILHAMQHHFVTNMFKPLWDKIQIWVKTSDSAKFSKIWEEISSDPLVPQSLIDYFKTEWMSITHMWSRVSRQNQHIFVEGDTNMLIEVYVILSQRLSLHHTKAAI